MDYIICNRKRSRARVKVDVCEMCMRMNKCSDYKDYIQPSLFPAFVKEMKATKDAYRRVVKLKNIKPELADRQDIPEQLMFNL